MSRTLQEIDEDELREFCQDVAYSLLERVFLDEDLIISIIEEEYEEAFDKETSERGLYVG